jgi:hypothetical protein
LHPNYELGNCWAIFSFNFGPIIYFIKEKTLKSRVVLIENKIMN